MLSAQKRLARIQGYLEELLAVLVLEYHNKNHLMHGARPKRLNEDQRELVGLCLEELRQIQEGS